MATIDEDAITRDRIQAAVDAHPNAAWAAAWRDAFLARGPVPVTPSRAAGLLYAVSTGDWEPRLRDLEIVRQRIHVTTWLARVADHWGREQDLARRALEAWAEAQVPPEDLEHVELPVVLAALNGDRKLPEGQRVQLTWRNQAGAALAWALGAFDDAEDAAAQADALGDLLPALHLAHARPLEEVREVLDRSRTELSGTNPRTARFHVLVERVKALRWLTEPWWPELALTPWKAGDQLSPSSAKAFDAAAARARMAALAPGRDTNLRPGPVVFRTGMNTLMSSYLSDAARTGDVHAAMIVLRVVKELPDFPQDGKDPKGRVEDRVWASAQADALFWATGLLETLPDADPPGDEYGTLVQAATDGTFAGIADQAGLRPRAELEAALDTLRRTLVATRPGTRAHRFAAEHARALRWVTETRWPTVDATPWDGSDSPSAPPDAPLAPAPRRRGPLTLLAAAAGVIGLLGLVAAGGVWMALS